MAKMTRTPRSAATKAGEVLAVVARKIDLIEARRAKAEADIAKYNQALRDAKVEYDYLAQNPALVTSEPSPGGDIDVTDEAAFATTDEAL